jgi:uncharacterized protein YggT (Ycf19 family)
MNSLAFLISTVFDLYIMIVLLRVWLQWSRADFYNPFSQFIVRVSQGRNPIEYVMNQLTEPLMAPIRRVLPAMGGLDLSILVLFLGLQFANYLMGDLIGPIWFQL